jgi:acetyl esterase/lipase
MDIYLPPEDVVSPATPLPVVVWWHGGGLLQGNKENLPPHLRRLPARELKGERFIVVSPNYRLAPQAPIRDILEDADSAANFVRTKLNDKLVAAGHGARVDPSRMVLSGGSAGGYLALMAGLPTPKSVPDAEVGGHRGPNGWVPLGVAPFYPITDLEHEFWATKTDPVPWWGQSVPDAAAQPHLNRKDPPVGSAVSGGPRSILYPYMLQHGLFPNLLFYNQRSCGSGLDGYRPSPESMGVTTRLRILRKHETPRPPIYMVYGTIDDKVQPLEETAELIRETRGPAEIEAIEGADHAFDENPAEQCPGFYAWLESVL